MSNRGNDRRLVERRNGNVRRTNMIPVEIEKRAGDERRDENRDENRDKNRRTGEERRH